MKTINLLPKPIVREFRTELVAGQVLKFWVWVVLSLALFFALVIGTIVYLRTEMQKTDQLIYDQKMVLSASNTKELENRVRELNSKIDNIKTLQKNHYYWSEAVLEVARIIPSDVELEAMILDRTANKVEISGTAKNRESVIQIWADLKRSPKFRDVNFPLNNLEKSADGNFTYAFYVKPEEIKKNEFAD
jgi:Tfp pilus assembly protein PilN